MKSQEKRNKYLVFILILISNSLVSQNAYSYPMFWKRIFKSKKNNPQKTINQNVHISSMRKLFDNFHCVQKNALYRSSQISPRRLKKYIKKNNIKSIINLRGENYDKKWWQREKKMTQKLGLEFYSIPMNASLMTEKKNLFHLLYLYKTATRPILIHCASGVDRTGEAAALWVLEEQKKSKREALKHLSWRYGFFRFRRPAKYSLVKNWQGFDWFFHK